MGVAYLPGRLVRWFYGPAKQPVVRRRWLVPDTLRIMKRFSIAPFVSQYFVTTTTITPATHKNHKKKQ
jgi:hypothetical protein